MPVRTSCVPAREWQRPSIVKPMPCSLRQQPPYHAGVYRGVARSLTTALNRRHSSGLTLSPSPARCSPPSLRWGGCCGSGAQRAQRARWQRRAAISMARRRVVLARSRQHTSAACGAGPAKACDVQKRHSHRRSHSHRSRLQRRCRHRCRRRRSSRHSHRRRHRCRCSSSSRHSHRRRHHCRHRRHSRHSRSDTLAAHRRDSRQRGSRW